MTPKLSLHADVIADAFIDLTCLGLALLYIEMMIGNMLYCSNFGIETDNTHSIWRSLLRSARDQVVLSN
jgi:hypothetical protein